MSEDQSPQPSEPVILHPLVDGTAVETRPGDQVAVGAIPAPLTPPTQPEPVAPDEKVVEAQGRYATLMVWLDKLAATFEQNPGAILVSRPSPDYLWEQTGFWIESGVVLAKVGRAMAQPMGRIKNDEFYPTEGSKLLWAHDFALCVIALCAGAFRVEKNDKPIETDATDSTQLSDIERKNMEEALGYLQEAMQSYSAAYQEGDAIKIAAEESDLLDTVRLASIRSRRLDAKLMDIYRKNPELKEDLSGMKTPALAELSMEYLRMKLNDDSHRRHFQQNSLVPTETTDLRVFLTRKIEQLTALLPEEAKDFNGLPLKAALEQLNTSYPPAADVTAKYVDTEDLQGAAKDLIAFLMSERDRLTPKTVATPVPAATDAPAA